MTATDRRLKDPKYNLEVGDDKPNIRLILNELKQAQSDAEKYFQRSDDCFALWHSQWEGQTLDGRKHAGEDGTPPFPFEGGSDTRMRTCERVVNEFCTVVEFAFDNAKIQAQSVREFLNARAVNLATQCLRWQISSQMRSDFQREMPLAIAWTGGYGSALLGADWHQSRRLDYIEINLPDLDTLMQSQGAGPMMAQLMDMIMDERQEDTLVAWLQQLSPILQQNKTEARKIIRYLRMEHVAKVPVANVFESRPRLRALRSMIDVIHPPDMDDPQSPDTRWMDEIYYVTETQAYDRIATDGWSEEFVEDAIKQKGKMTNERWRKWSNWERSRYSGEGYAPFAQAGAESYRDLIEIHEFRIRVHHFNVPCLYKTVFSPHVVGKDRDNPLYAKHGPDENQHGRFPYAAMRFEQLERPLLSSRGIPEIIYNWEQEEKTQADGISDLTGMTLQPPLIVPKDRANAVAGQMRPSAVLGVTRPNEFQWMKPPQFNNLPILVQERIDKRIANYFGWFAPEAYIDPDKKQLCRQRTAKRHLNQIGVAIDLILELDKQYLPDDEETAGKPAMQRPFPINRSDIAGAYQISGTIDMKMLNEDYAMQKIDMIGKVMPFNQAGTAKMDQLFKSAMEIIDTDMADAVVEEDQGAATAKEQQDERSAISAAFNGIESPLPMYGNHRLRLQTITQDVLQSQNPRMRQRLMQNPDTYQILQKRMEFFQNQIQQYEQNPGIGRALSTQTFAPKMAPQLTGPGDQG
jgi:hypothetical protein